MAPTDQVQPGTLYQPDPDPVGKIVEDIQKKDPSRQPDRVHPTGNKPISIDPFKHLKK